MMENWKQFIPLEFQSQAAPILAYLQAHPETPDWAFDAWQLRYMKNSAWLFHLTQDKSKPKSPDVKQLEKGWTLLEKHPGAIPVVVAAIEADDADNFPRNLAQVKRTLTEPEKGIVADHLFSKFTLYMGEEEYEEDRNDWTWLWGTQQAMTHMADALEQVRGMRMG